MAKLADLLRRRRGSLCSTRPLAAEEGPDARSPDMRDERANKEGIAYSFRKEDTGSEAELRRVRMRRRGIEGLTGGNNCRLA